jgi:glycosyltransferase involved in cell wall biosynthesis
MVRSNHVCELPSGNAAAVTGSLLIIGNFLSGVGGSRCVCEELAHRLSGRGWKVWSASCRRNRLARLADMVWAVWSKRKDYEIAHIDVFSSAAFFWAEAVCLVLRVAQKPYVLTLRGGQLPHFSHRWPRRVRRLLSSASIVTAPSGYLQESLARFCPDMILLPNALDLARYEYRLPGPPLSRLVWLRAFHETYNPRLAVRTLAILRRQAVNVRLSMIGPDKGDGSYQATRALARELSVEDCIEFVPGVPKSEVPSYLRAGDIFLNTPHIDNAPVTVIEAMACGLCVVSTAVGGMMHLLSDGQDGLLTPDDDAESMAAAVLRILNDPALATRLSLNGRRKAEAHDWQSILDRWEALLSSAAENRRAVGVAR